MRSISARLASAFLGSEPEAAAEPLAPDQPDPEQHARLVRGFEMQGSGWLWETDRHGRLTYLSEKVIKQRDPGLEPAIGMHLTELFGMAAADRAERTLKFHLNARTPFSDYEVRLNGAAENRSWSITGRPWLDQHGQFRGFVGSGADLTEKRQSDTEIVRLARFDSLTGLANRASMHSSLEQALARPTGSYRPISLMLLDLDRFKAVNDTMGHPAGDALLQQVAERLTEAVGDRGLVGRLGGDEFQVLLPGERSRERLAELANTIIESLSRAYPVHGVRAVIGCSVGIAIAPDHGETPQELVRNADLALYSAKADGRGVHRFYQDAMLKQARTRRMVEDDLRNALALDQLSLVYQPVVSVATKQIVGYEALLRWTHPIRGVISPAEFVPVAEDSGLIDPIGEWVLRTACNAAAQWPADVRVAVNVSPVQFGKPSLALVVANALAASGLRAERLELEITEGVFLDGGQSTDDMFRSLKQLGVRLALDDFGTGYSSLGYLRTAPFDKIKIDQSFVRGALEKGSRNAAIIRAIVTLADTLGLETTAEGVEAQDEVELIMALGCSHIQGYVYGRPIPPGEIAAQLAAGSATPVGVRVTRAPRSSMLRSALLRRGEQQGSCRIRNRSDGGAMIDSVAGFQLQPGDRVELDLGTGFHLSSVRWTNAGRAGLMLLPMEEAGVA